MATNILGNYDPIFYANEALIALNNALGMAGRVHRGYDASAQQKGSVINITRPAVFEATDVNTSTGGTTQELNPENVSITLNNWKEVKFGLTDKELAYTKEQIINDHIVPATYAIANAIDVSLAKLYRYVPWTSSIAATPAIGDVTSARKVLFNNGSPLEDLHMMVDGNVEAGLLNISNFVTGSGSGSAGVEAQLRGHIGMRYGMEIFANQNVQSATSGTFADTAGALNADTAVGDTSLKIKSLTNADAFKIGDVIVITGDAQKYTVQTAVTVAETVATVTVFPAIKQVNPADAVVTVVLPSGSGASKNQNLAFHRGAFALAMAPLSDLGGQLGARVGTVSDPITNLSIRSRLWYDGEHSTVKVGLDALWGVKCLNPNLAVRCIQSA